MSFDLKIENGNLKINNGSIKKVLDSEKLIQDVLKICLTDAGTNVLHPWYGSFVSRNIVGSSQDLDLLITIGRNQLVSALENLKTLQQLQTKTVQNITADEQISSVLNVSILKNSYDPRQIDVEITIITKGLKPITTAFQISTI